MKIYVLPVNESLQPKSQPFRYPAHNEDYGVEQDFYRYIMLHEELTTTNPNKADWHYLPVFWTRWHLNHDFAQTGLIELKQAVDKYVLDDSKTFTICQYDGGSQINLGQAVTFMAGRINERGIDIPILCTPHRKPLLKPRKKYLASFNGAINTHPIRQEMVDKLKNKDGICVGGYLSGRRFFSRIFMGSLFVQSVMASYVALCPRGSNGNSFRFFEAMQLGTVPFLVGDLDTRPFKKFIDWNRISFFSTTIANLQDQLDSLKKPDVLSMGENAFTCWKEHLSYQRWCKYVFKELEEIRQ